MGFYLRQCQGTVNQKLFAEPASKRPLSTAKQVPVMARAELDARNKMASTTSCFSTSTLPRG